MLANDRLVYLAYGSNLHPRRITSRIGDAQFLDVIRLPGWRLVFDKRGADASAKANLRPAPGSEHVAWAAAYAIPRSKLAGLDQFEGCGRGYETFLMDVLVDNQSVAAHVYLTPSHWTSVSMCPFDWYLELVLAGARWHDFPQAYIESIARQTVVEDADRNRYRENLAPVRVVSRNA